MDATMLHVIAEAEQVVLNGRSTKEQVAAAIAAVDALGDPEWGAAIRRTAGEWRPMAEEVAMRRARGEDPLVRLKKAKKP